MYCVEHGDWGHFCLRFPAGAVPGDALGDPCGPGDTCQLGLVCLKEGAERYCTGACDLWGEYVRRDCPPGWRCAERRGGRLACIPGDPDAGMAADAGDAGTEPDADAADPTAGPGDGSPDGGCCAMVPAPARRRGAAAWLALGLLAAVLLRRRLPA